MKSFALVLAAALVSTSASAATINGLYNTGVQAGGAGTGAGAGATTGNGLDPNWTYAGGTNTASGANAYNGGTNGSFPIGPWLAEDATSRWITPQSNAANSFDPSASGTYNYQLAFDLTGFRPGTASFLGRFASDNRATISLNGNVIASGVGFSGWTNFGAATGFINGVNLIGVTLTNDAQNGGNPAGFRVEFAQSGVAAVPEPAQWALLIGGFGVVGFAARRRRVSTRITYA